MFAFAMPGPTELLIVLFIAMLLFGGSRLPKLARGLGASAKEFQRGIENGMEAAEDAKRVVKSATDELSKTE